MELKTDGGIYITREEYREKVTKVMNKQSKLALVAVAGLLVSEEGIDPKKVEEGVNQALSLQMQALANMERALFGKPIKKDEEAKN